MGYELALNKAWTALKEVSQEKKLQVKFLADQYEVDLENSKIHSLSCNLPAKDFLSILILHYLAAQLSSSWQVGEEWVSFKEIPGGLGYYPAFRKRCIEPIISKYGKSPRALLGCLERFPGRRIEHGDYAIVLEAFERVPVLITIYGQDEEFSAEVNMLFDKTITQIFCTEDIAVVAGIIAHSI